MLLSIFDDFGSYSMSTLMGIESNIHQIIFYSTLGGYWLRKYETHLEVIFNVVFLTIICNDAKHDHSTNIDRFAFLAELHASFSLFSRQPAFHSPTTVHIAKGCGLSDFDAEPMACSRQIDKTYENPMISEIKH